MPTEEVDKSIEIGSELQLLGWELNTRSNLKIINVAITYMTHCKIQFNMRGNPHKRKEICGRSTPSTSHFTGVCDFIKFEGSVSFRTLSKK